MSQATLMALCPYFIVLYMLLLFVIVLALIPVVPVMLLGTYLRYGTLEVEPIEDKL